MFSSVIGILTILSLVDLSRGSVWFDEADVTSYFSYVDFGPGCSRMNSNAFNEQTCTSQGVKIGYDFYEWENAATVYSYRQCVLTRDVWVDKSAQEQTAQLRCWSEVNLFHDPSDKCSSKTSKTDCENRRGCYWQENRQECADDCSVTFNNDIPLGEHSSSSMERCIATDGCGYDPRIDRCFSGHSRLEATAKLCVDTPGWHDSDGAYYDCEWYNFPEFYWGDSRCKTYGHAYRNFGKTANEACCGCKREKIWGDYWSRRRELDEDLPPKHGFLHHGALLRGYAREIIPQLGVFEFTLVDSEDMGAPESDCAEFNWWNSQNGLEVECPQGEALGTLFKYDVNENFHPKYNLEKGYCCKAPVTRDCVLKPVTRRGNDEFTCDEHFVLTGFEMIPFEIDIEHVAQIKCCRLDLEFAPPFPSDNLPEKGVFPFSRRM